jgi:hypothetical protein
MQAADFQDFAKADGSTASDDYLRSLGADVDEDLHFLLVVRPADEALESAEQAGDFRVQGCDDYAAVFQLLKVLIDLRILNGKHNHFLLRLVSLAHFPCRKTLDLSVIEIELEKAARFFQHRGFEFAQGHDRKAEIFNVDNLARQRCDYTAADERLLGKNLADDLGGLLRPPLGISSGFFGKRLLGGGHHAELMRGGTGIASDLELQHFDAVETEIQANGLNL